MAAVKSAPLSKKSTKTSLPAKNKKDTSTIPVDSEPKNKVETPKKDYQKGKKPKNENDATATTSHAIKDFPRGGGSALTPLEYKEVAQQAEAEADLFADDVNVTGKQPGAKKRKTTSETSGPVEKKKKTTTRKDRKDYTEDSVRAKKEPKVDSLTFKHLSVGSLLLGQVTAITALDLAISLPNHLTAYCPITAISSTITGAVERAAEADEDAGEGLPDLFKLFHVGQWVRCIVTLVNGGQQKTETQQKRRIEVALRPELVNAGVSEEDLAEGLSITATVTSVEDHGYILSFGLAGDRTGFLPLSEAKAIAPQQYSLGQIVNVVVTKGGRAVRVTADPEMTAKATLTSPPTKMSSLLPGVLVEGTVKHVYSNGLVCTLLGFFEAHVDWNHLNERIVASEKEIQASYKVGQKIKGRLTHISLSSQPKRVNISLAPHVVNLTEDELPIRIGTIFDRVVVRRVDSGNGLLCQVENSLDIIGYVHISRVADEHLVALSSTTGAYRTGSIHRARVVARSPVDGQLQLSLQASVVNARWLRVEDVQAGEDVRGTIKSLIPAGALVNISSTITALCPSIHLSDIKLTHPERKFKEGAVVNARVFQTYPEQRRVLLTFKKALLTSPYPALTSIEMARPGQLYHGIIIAFCDAGCIVAFYNGVRALAPTVELSESFIKTPSDVFAVGQVVRCRVLTVELSKQRLRVSFKDAPSSTQKSTEAEPTPRQERRKLPSLKFDDLQVDSVVEGTVARVQTGVGLYIRLGDDLFGRVIVTDVADEFKEDATAGFGKGDRVKCCVVTVDKPNKRVDLSLRSSRIAKADGSEPVEETKIVNKEINVTSDIHLGDVVSGYIKNVADQGLFVWLGRNVVARVKIAELSDDYIKDWKSTVEIGKLVQGRVINVDSELHQVELSLKASAVDPSSVSNLKKDTMTLADLEQGQKVKGTITKVESYGVFIRVDGTRSLTGLCHISEISDTKISDVGKLYSAGDRVKTVVLKVDTERKRLSFGLKSSYFEDADMESDSSDEEDGDEMDVEEEEEEGTEEVSGDEEVDEEENEDEEDATNDNDIESSDEAMEVDEDEEMASEDEDDVEVPALNVKGGFNWDGDDADDDEESVASDASDSEGEDVDSDAEMDKKKKKKKQLSSSKLLALAQAESEASEANNRAPTVAADYERLLVGSPNSSYIWINYMAFQLQLSEIDKARAVAERALKAINFREEQEKLNVWVAMMNLENRFGDDTSLDAIVKRAVEACEPKTVYLQLVRVFERSDKFERAENIFELLTKKFGSSSKVWTIYGLFKLKRKDLDGARQLLQRSLKSLPKRKHIKTISKFAQLEFRHGDAERGRTVFEGIMSSYPKRVDLWSIYLDMEIRAGDKDTIRRLFQRVVGLKKFSSKKMKFFFKKWLLFEREHGDESTQQTVREAAMAYVESQV